MKKLVNKRFVLKVVGVFLFAAALFFNFNVSKHQSEQASGNTMPNVMLTASAQGEDYRWLATYNSNVFDCYCVPGNCLKCACGC